MKIYYLIITNMSIAYLALVSKLSRIASTDSVLDVSSFKLNGTGLVIINKSKSLKNGIELSMMPIVSDNFHTYHIAMGLLGSQFSIYSKLYQERFEHMIHSSEDYSGSDPSDKIFPSYTTLLNDTRIIQTESTSNNFIL